MLTKKFVGELPIPLHTAIESVNPSYIKPAKTQTLIMQVPDLMMQNESRVDQHKPKKSFWWISVVAARIFASRFYFKKKVRSQQVESTQLEKDFLSDSLSGNEL